MEQTPERARFAIFAQMPWRTILIVAAGLAFGTWLMLTPSGLLGKADAAGYAVCHRIGERSFHIGDRQMPLCARCSGMYLGALVGMAYLTRFGKRAGMPVLKVAVVLGLALVWFGVDGVNSYFHLFPGFRGIYEPSNWMRLVTGTGVGLGIAAVLTPAVHQTLWPTVDDRPALSGWRAFLPMVGLAGLIILALLSDLDVLLYPLALLSAVSVFLILSITYGVVWLLISKRANSLLRYRQAWAPLTAGFLTALLQIGVFDALRYWLTGTWAGFVF